jgi:malate dehydrogenase (oxaloacetate-decarboxylating)
MLDFERCKDKTSGEEWIETSITGKPLLTTPQLNKGTAFTLEERHTFGLIGKLPTQVETLEQQVDRAYQQFLSFKGNLNRNIYLNNLMDANQTLFFKLVSEHLPEMLPVIYTPIVGTAVKKFSQEFRQARGIYISYPDRHYMDEVLDNRSQADIDLIVVTDGEGVLGIGDQGIGGMDIPIAKLMVYTLCADIDPTHTLPILLDVGTNNRELLEDPMYLGWRHERLQGKAYDDFIEQFVTTIRRKFPDVFLHWEDFGRDNARRNLERYRHTLCTFNDDMQGTGAVTLAAILAGMKVNQQNFSQQQIVIFGAGTAGTGIADQIYNAMLREGLSKAEAYSRFWLIDRAGLLTTQSENLTNFQRPYAHDVELLKNWTLDQAGSIQLIDVVRNVKPTILIGCSSVSGAFTETVIKEMARHIHHPIILPLSNPTEHAEATPKDLLEWTQGTALIATGSPFEPVLYQGRETPIAQCNNAFVFPGLGLGLIATKAKWLSDDVLWETCRALSEYSPALKDATAPLLPSLQDAQKTAKHIALRVAQQVLKEGASNLPNNTDLSSLISHQQWLPYYVPYRYRMPAVCQDPTFR